MPRAFCRCVSLVQSQSAFLSAVMSSGLKEGIVHIMTKNVARKLNFRGRPSLLVAGLMAAALPAMINALNAPVVRAQAVTAAPASEVHARGDIAGDWKGTLHAQNYLLFLLMVTKKAKSESGTK